MQQIVIIDYGSQYTHLISNRIRKMGVYTEIIADDEEIPENVAGIILSGGPNSVYEKNAPQVKEEVFKHVVPVLGLCYGHQLIGQYFGGKVKAGKVKEYGVAELSVFDSSIFANLDAKEQVWMSHGDAIQELPEGFKTIGSTVDCSVAAMENSEKKIFGFQFHPEVTHSIHGVTILSNFVFGVCECKKNWNMDNYIDEIMQKIQQKVGDKKVFMLVSGGVDSSVAFTLLNKALDTKNVYGLFINNGLLRKGEFEQVNEMMNKLEIDNFNSIDASDEFLDKLENVYDPEKKRRIIGDTFIDVQKKCLDTVGLNGDEWLLGQGTIYPDIIESKGTKHADLIKTHHNRVPQIQKMIKEGRVIEPLDHLYKDEVREMGLKLELSKELVYRHPFPGPGLGIRCLCNEVTEEIGNEEEINNNIQELVDTIDNSLKGYAIPLRSVGVQGDVRTYRHPAVIEGKASWNTLEKVSTKLTNSVPDINRVIYRLTEKRENQENEENLETGMYITQKRLDVLREADNIAMEMLNEHDVNNKVWQMPTILVPWGADGKESIILRPVGSMEAMTAEFSKLDNVFVKKLAENIMATGLFSAVFFDVTNKPPGTIEWE